MTKYTTSPLLINEPPLQVLPSLATCLGVNHAIFLQQIQYWMGHTNNVVDGYRWVYNPYTEWQKQMPWLSVSGIRKIVDDLEAKGVLVSGVFNKAGMDRTKWYRIDYATLNEICHLPQSDTPSVTEGHMMCPGVADDVPQSDRPIPETTPETTQDIAGGNTKSKRATSLPKDWQPGDTLVAWANREGFSATEMQRELPQFIDHHTAVGSTFKDWDAAFRKWMRNSRKFAKPQRGERKQGGLVF